MTITTKQRKQIRAHLGTFTFVSADLADRITECAIEFRISKPSDMLWSLFHWGETFEGHSRWKAIVDFFIVEEKVLTQQPKELTQADVQALLNILRIELDGASFCKNHAKENAAEEWKHCIKGSEIGQNAFENFSYCNSSHKYHKQREKALVGLITKLKGLR